MANTNDKTALLIRTIDVFDGEAMLGCRDVLVENGLISMIAEPGSITSATREFDGTGLMLCPGFTDLHCHLRDPGLTWKEDIISGTRSAAAGGYTTLVSMPNTKPPVDQPAVAEYIRDRAEREGFARVSPSGCISRSRRGEELSDLAGLYAAGVRVFTDDGSDTSGDDVFLHAMEFLSMLPGTMAMIHTEVPSLAQGVMHLGGVSSDLGHEGIHPLSEDLGTARAVLTALHARQHVHITHMASRGAVELVRFGKAQAELMGIPGLVTCDATFNHLILTEEAVREHGPQAKINPPLRSEEDRVALLEALADGTLDALVTDHAPHTEDEKTQEMELAPFGFIGFEISLGLLFKYVVGQETQSGRITREMVLRLMSSAPARLLAGDGLLGSGIPPLSGESLADFRPRELMVSPGLVEVGATADLAVVDPGVEYVIDPQYFYSKSANTPFAGASAQGRVVLTLCGGRITHGEV